MIRTMRGRHCQVRNSCGGVPSRKGLISHKRKTVIQALDWLDLFCHFRRSAPECHGFEYYRHGTLSLYAALNTVNGRLICRAIWLAIQRSEPRSVGGGVRGQPPATSSR